MLAHRGQKAAERVAGHGRRGSRLAPSERPVGGLDPDQEIFRVLDGDAGHRHGLCERHRDADRVDPPDPERRTLVRLLHHRVHLRSSGHAARSSRRDK
jgi:hypothetical protein